MVCARRPGWGSHSKNYLYEKENFSHRKIVVFGLLLKHGFRAHTLYPGAREHNSCPWLKEMFTKRNTDHSKSLRPIRQSEEIMRPRLALDDINQLRWAFLPRNGTFLVGWPENPTFKLNLLVKIFSYRVGTCQRNFLSCKTISVWKLSDANSYDFAMFVVCKFSVFFRLRQMIYWPTYIFLYKPQHCAGCFQFI